MKKQLLLGMTLALSLNLTGCATTPGQSNGFLSTIKTSAISIGSSIKTAAVSAGGSIKNYSKDVFGGYEKGTHVTPEMLHEIRKGKTTEDQVIALLGHPESQQVVNHRLIWKYPYTAITQFNGNTHETTFVEFKHHVVVKAYTQKDNLSDEELLQGITS